MVAGVSPRVTRPGATVTVTGEHFTGTTAVSVNGVAAVFTEVSDTRLRVTVPVGATSGPIVVTTAAGSTTGPSVFIWAWRF